MDGDPRNFFNSLYKQLANEKSGSGESRQILANFNDVLTQDEVNLSLLDLYLQHMFKKPHGFQKFISTIVNKKEFKSSVTSVYEIIFTLINNFSTKLEKHVIIIHEICFKVIKSTLVSVDEKVKAYDVLILSFEKIDKSLENTDHYKEICIYLMNSMSIRKSPTVEEKMLVALGTFAKKFPLLVSDSHRMRLIFLCGLEKHMLATDFSYKSVYGLFTGLNAFCENFPFDVNEKEDQAICKKICKYIFTLSVTTASIKMANRAALTFFANNIQLFVDLMMEDVKKWHTNLLEWIHYGAEDQKVGALVIGAFYRGLGDFYKRDSELKYKTDFEMDQVEFCWQNSLIEIKHNEHIIYHAGKA